MLNTKIRNEISHKIVEITLLVVEYKHPIIQDRLTSNSLFRNVHSRYGCCSLNPDTVYEFIQATADCVAIGIGALNKKIAVDYNFITLNKPKLTSDLIKRGYSIPTGFQTWFQDFKPFEKETVIQSLYFAIQLHGRHPVSWNMVLHTVMGKACSGKRFERLVIVRNVHSVTQMRSHIQQRSMFQSYVKLINFILIHTQKTTNTL